MAFTIAQFRLDFPEFGDDTVYTDSMITFWSDLGQELNDPLWYNNDTVYVSVISLFTAHQITLQANDIAQSGAGGGAGITPTTGSVSEKTVGSVSVSYDSSSSNYNQYGAAFWNLTSYGKQYWLLQLMYGSNVFPI